MKKIISLIICVILVFGINFISNAGAVEPKDVELDDLYMLEQLSPYLSIIDKLNKEYEGEFVIPEGGLIEVYNNTLKIPLNEFEDIYRRYYEELKNIPTIINIDVRENQNIKSSNDANSLETIDLPAIEAKAPIESSDAINKDNTNVIPFSVREDVRQETSLGDNKGMVFLDAHVISGSGQLGTFSYSKIYGYGSYIYR